MKLTILQPGDVPATLADRFGPYSRMFEDMFARVGHPFETEVVNVFAGEPLPDIADVEAVLIGGSSAGVYDDFIWMEPLRGFIRAAYSASTPMVGVCFGHQIIADALGGDVRKSEKGWGLGRHTYEVASRPPFLPAAGTHLAISCSHQDQVIAPPAEAEVVLRSPFTPNAALLYRNGNTLSFQPHPEFTDDYAQALVDLRRGRAPEPVIDTAFQSFATPSDSAVAATAIAQFFAGRAAA